jgi:hypothetical protein
VWSATVFVGYEVVRDLPGVRKSGIMRFVRGVAQSG